MKTTMTKKNRAKRTIAGILAVTSIMNSVISTAGSVSVLAAETSPLSMTQFLDQEEDAAFNDIEAQPESEADAEGEAQEQAGKGASADGESFRALDLEETESKEESSFDRFNRLMRKATMSGMNYALDMEKKQINKNLPNLIDSALGAVPGGDIVKKLGVSGKLSKLLCKAIGIYEEEESGPSLSDIRNDISELRSELRAATEDIKGHMDETLINSLEGIIKLNTLNSYKDAMSDLCNCLTIAENAMIDWDTLNGDEQLIALASIAGDWGKWDQGGLVHSVSVVGGYISGQNKFHSTKSFYECIYEAALMRNGVFSGEAKQEANDYINSVMSAYLRAYNIALLSINAQDAIGDLKNDGIYAEFCEGMKPTIKETASGIRTNDFMINSMRMTFEGHLVGAYNTPAGNTVMDQYSAFQNMSNSIFICETAGLSGERKDLQVANAAIRCDDSIITKGGEGKKSVNGDTYTSLYKSNLRALNEKDQKRLLDYAKKNNLSIADVLKKANIEIPEGTRYFLASPDVFFVQSDTEEVSKSVREMGLGSINSTDRHYVKAYDIYDTNLEIKEVTVKIIHHFYWWENGECKRYSSDIQDLPTLNFLSFAQKTDSSSLGYLFGKKNDSYYNLTSGVYKLDQDMKLDTALNIASGSNVTIDLNGHKLDRALGSAAEGTGSVIYVSAGASLTVIDSVGTGSITGGYAKRGGAVFVPAGASCMLKGITVSTNRAADKGGAVYNNGVLTIDHCVIGGNTSVDGGAVYNDQNGDMTVSGTAFKSNKATKNGGGAISAHGKLTVQEGSSFIENSGKEGGGAIWTNTNITVNDSTFRDNTSGSLGGAICVRDNSVATMKNVVFEKNTGNDGGAIFVDKNAEATINSAVFKENKTTEYGGGAISANGKLTVTDFEFTNNHAKKQGGAILTKKELTLTTGKISGNTSENVGGAIYLSDGTADIRNAMIDNNQSSNHGGAIRSDGGTTLKVYDSTIKYNTSEKDGGGCFIKGTNEFYNTEFFGNKASEKGGAVDIDGGKVTFYACNIHDNIAPKGSILRYADGAKYEFKDGTVKEGSVY